MAVTDGAGYGADAGGSAVYGGNGAGGGGGLGLGGGGDHGGGGGDIKAAATGGIAAQGVHVRAVPGTRQQTPVAFSAGVASWERLAVRSIAPGKYQGGMGEGTPPPGLTSSCVATPAVIYFSNPTQKKPQRPETG